MTPSFSRSFFLIAGLCCLLPGIQTEGYQDTQASGHNKKQEPPQCQTLAPIITNISLFLLQNAMHQPKQTNIALSPMSIVAAFTMLSLGASGSTHKEILKGLGLSFIKKPAREIHKCFQYLLHILLKPDHQLHLTTGNTLFISKFLRMSDKFKKAITGLYHTEAVPINFKDIQEAKAQVNNHVMMRSYGHIVQGVEDLPINTVLALVNYISFSGVQNGEFQDEYIMEEKFHLDKHKVVLVSMINRLGKFYLQKVKSLSSWVLLQHYVGDAMAFFILPDLGKMQQLVQNLSHDYLKSIQSHIHPRYAKLQFPRFTISSTYDLKTVMKTLGIKQIFSKKADLSKLTEDTPVKLSKAVHKAVLRIEERETQVPEGLDLYQTLWPKVLTVMFNRPFLVIIKDETLDLPFLMAKVGIPDHNNYT